MHTSRTDVDLAARAARCGCHRTLRPTGSLTPASEKRQPERGDLRKHHSAEGDKWSLRPDADWDLRKHLSDDSRMHEREPKWTLQVPELHANPKQRCTCPKQPRALSLTPSASPSGSDSSRRPSPMLVRSLTPELPPMRRRGESLRKKQRERPSLSPVTQGPQQAQQTQQPQQPQQPQPPQDSKKMSKKERQQLGEAKRAIRSKWAVKPHFSLPAERKEERWTNTKEGKSKSLKERPKYSVRRSMSPEPDQILRTDNRVVRRLISSEVQLRDAKWMPYEGYSPLPAVGLKKREAKKMISDIQWRPYDESPVKPKPKLAELKVLPSEDEQPQENDGPEDFHKITPPHAPPPEASPAHLTDDEQFRMRMLNQVSCFPIYQGAWREESPPPPTPPPDLSTPVWSPYNASTVTAAQLRKQSLAPRHSPSPQPSASPPDSPSPRQRKRSTLKLRSSRKKAARAKSQESTRHDQRKQSAAGQLLAAPQPPRSILSRASSEDPAVAAASSAPRRPQLLRSKAFALELPAGRHELSKRALSEEVRSYNPRSESTRRGLFSRAKSEDASRSHRPLSPDEDDSELREYVTTV